VPVWPILTSEGREVLGALHAALQGAGRDVGLGRADIAEGGAGEREGHAGEHDRALLDVRVAEVDDVIVRGDLQTEGAIAGPGLVAVARAHVGGDPGGGDGDVGRPDVAEGAVGITADDVIAVEVEGVVQVLLLEVGQGEGHPGPPAAPLDARRQAALGVVVVVHRQADLLQVVGALGAPGGLAGTLHGRQEQGDEHADDRDDHQQLDQGETASPRIRDHISFFCLEKEVGRNPTIVDGTGPADGG
jgi:hypothetical protein